MHTGIRRELFDGSELGDGPLLLREILPKASKGLFGAVRLATDAESASGSLAPGSQGPAVYEIGVMTTKLQMLIDMINKERLERLNDVNSLQQQITASAFYARVQYNGFRHGSLASPAFNLPSGGTFIRITQWTSKSDDSVQISRVGGGMYVPYGWDDKREAEAYIRERY